MAKWGIVFNTFAICIWLAVRLLASIFRFISNLLDSATDYLHACVNRYEHIHTLPNPTPSAPEMPPDFMSEHGKGPVDICDRMKVEVGTPEAVPLAIVAAAVCGKVGEPRTVSAGMGTGLPVEYVNGPKTVWKAGQKRKFYAVVRGFQPGIYETWDECNQQVWGFSDCKFKSFKTRAEAVEYMHNGLRARGTWGMPHTAT